MIIYRLENPPQMSIICSLCNRSVQISIVLCPHEEHDICINCYDEECSIRICPNIPYTDNPDIILKKGIYPYHRIQRMIYPYAESLGMIPHTSDGIRIYIDPIETVVETDGYRMNLLQYVIFHGEYTSIDTSNSTEFYIFDRAFYSVIHGIDNDISDIASLYHTLEIEFTGEGLFWKAHNMSNHIKGCRSRSIHRDNIVKWYQSMYTDDELSLILDECLRRRWISQNGDIYQYNI